MTKIRMEAEDIVTEYRNFSLSNITFSLISGDIMGLVGRSGSGKSTLIQTLTGLKKAKKGKITAYVNDKKTRINNIIGYSPQENSLFPFLTLEENIITFAKLHNVQKTELSKKMDFLLKRLNLAKARDKKITQLSGGMQKRADIAVTLIHSPDIIILDEPFNGLDVSLQQFIWNILAELAKNGRIIIVSSHFLTDIQMNCNKVGLVERGKFYSTDEVKAIMIKNKTRSLKAFLEKVFTEDLMVQSR